MTKYHDDDHAVPDYDPIEPIIPDGFEPDVEGAMRIPAPRPFTADELAAHDAAMRARWPALAAQSNTCLMACAGQCAGVMWGKQAVYGRKYKALPLSGLPLSRVTLHTRVAGGWQCVKCGATQSR